MLVVFADHARGHGTAVGRVRLSASPCVCFHSKDQLTFDFDCWHYVVVIDVNKRCEKIKERQKNFRKWENKKND